MHVGDKPRLLWNCRDRSKIAFLHAQQCPLPRWVGLAAVGLYNIALEHQVPRLSLRLLDRHHRPTGEIKIHPDISGARINSIDNRAYQSCADCLRLRRRRLVSGGSGIVMAHDLTATADEEQYAYPQADKTPYISPRH